MTICKLLLLFVLLCLLPDPVAASGKCLPATTKTGFAHADAVFAGEAVAQEVREAESITADGRTKLKGTIVATEFKVEKFWKGGGEKTIFIINYKNSNEDSRPGFQKNYQFKLNQNYIVYAYDYQNALHTIHGRCSKTRLLDQASEDLKTLGTGDAPTKTVDKTLGEILTEFIDKWNN